MSDQEAYRAFLTVRGPGGEVVREEWWHFAASPAQVDEFVTTFAAEARKLPVAGVEWTDEADEGLSEGGQEEPEPRDRLPQGSDAP